MKAKLIFDLSDPDDSHSHMIAVKASDMHSVIYDMCAWFRDQLKHQPLTEDQYAVLEKAQKELLGLLYDNDLRNLIEN